MPRVRTTLKKKTFSGVSGRVAYTGSYINFDGEILFRKIAHHLDPEIKKMLVKGIIRTRIPHCTLVHDFFAIEIKILFLNLTM